MSWLRAATPMLTHQAPSKRASPARLQPPLPVHSPCCTLQGPRAALRRVPLCAASSSSWHPAHPRNTARQAQWLPVCRCRTMSVLAMTSETLTPSGVQARMSSSAPSVQPTPARQCSSERGVGCPQPPSQR